MNRAVEPWLRPTRIAPTCCIALLIGLAVAIVLEQRRRAAPPASPPPDETSVTLAHISSLYIDCEEYRRKIGFWPTSIFALTNLLPKTSTSILTDGWGGPMMLIQTTNVPSQTLLISYGPDHSAGGAGTNGDIFYILK